jgi:sensor domain CHASE-containing protein
MSLRAKVVAILVGVFALYGLLDYAVQRLVVLPSFVALERDEARRNLMRAVQAIDREAQLLAPSAADWATWDDTYRFIQDRNQAYIDANLQPSALQQLKINLLNFYDTQGKLVWGRAQQVGSDEQIQLGELSAAKLPTNHVLLAQGSPEAAVNGLYI